MHNIACLLCCVSTMFFPKWHDRQFSISSHQPLPHFLPPKFVSLMFVSLSSIGLVIKMKSITTISQMFPLSHALLCMFLPVKQSPYHLYIIFSLFSKSWKYSFSPLQETVLLKSRFSSFQFSVHDFIIF